MQICMLQGEQLNLSQRSVVAAVLKLELRPGRVAPELLASPPKRQDHLVALGLLPFKKARRRRPYVHRVASIPCAPNAPSLEDGRCSP